LKPVITQDELVAQSVLLLALRVQWAALKLALLLELSQDQLVVSLAQFWADSLVDLLAMPQAQHWVKSLMTKSLITTTA
jgi:hypothetical protein